MRILPPEALLLLLRSNAGMVMSDLEVDVLDELDSTLKFLLGSPQLVPEVSPRWPQACSFECVGWTLFQDVFWSCLEHQFHMGTRLCEIA